MVDGDEEETSCRGIEGIKIAAAVWGFIPLSGLSYTCLGLIKHRSHVIRPLRIFLLSDTINPPKYFTSPLSLCNLLYNSLGI